MIEKINLINELLKKYQIKAIKIKSINIQNLIFSINNIGVHYVTTYNKKIWYCYKVYENNLPNNENETINYCSKDNLHISLHDNDYNRRIKLVCGTNSSINMLLKYLKDLKK